MEVGKIVYISDKDDMARICYFESLKTFSRTLRPLISSKVRLQTQNLTGFRWK